MGKNAARASGIHKVCHLAIDGPGAQVTFRPASTAARNVTLDRHLTVGGGAAVADSQTQDAPSFQKAT